MSVDDIVISDEQGPVALGGVIGGERSGISDTTTTLLLESANFDPYLVRQTSRKFDLRTDASNRFEKSLSASAVPVAIRRFVDILAPLNPRMQVKGCAQDYPEMPEDISVSFSYSYINNRLGTTLSSGAISAILEGLGFRIETLSEDAAVASVPYYRATRDISIEDDLVEEIGRIYGYENIPEEAPRIVSNVPSVYPLGRIQDRVRESLTAQGFCETYNYSFMNSALAEKLGFSLATCLKLKNPIDANNDVVRTSLIPGLIQTLEKNLKEFSSVSVYELGKISLLKAGDIDESRVEPRSSERALVGLAFSTDRDERALESVCKPSVSAGVHFYTLVGVVRKLVCLWGAQNELKIVPFTDGAAESKSYRALPQFYERMDWMHPHRCGGIELNGTRVGVIAEVVPGVIQGKTGRSVLVEMDLHSILDAVQTVSSFSSVSRYPRSFFEMSVVAPKNTHYRELERLFNANRHAHFKDVEVVSIYSGEPLDPEEKSISVKFYFGVDDRTLEPEELKLVQDHYVSILEGSSYRLRGS